MEKESNKIQCLFIIKKKTKLNKLGIKGNFL